jgi:hypothetical protein
MGFGHGGWWLHGKNIERIETFNQVPVKRCEQRSNKKTVRKSSSSPRIRLANPILIRTLQHQNKSDTRAKGSKSLTHSHITPPYTSSQQNTFQTSIQVKINFNYAKPNHYPQNPLPKSNHRYPQADLNAASIQPGPPHTK